jgi:hypothetical protein
VYERVDKGAIESASGDVASTTSFICFEAHLNWKMKERRKKKRER